MTTSIVLISEGASSNWHKFFGKFTDTLLPFFKIWSLMIGSNTCNEHEAGKQIPKLSDSPFVGLL